MEQEAGSTIQPTSQQLPPGDLPTVFPSFQDFQSLQKEGAQILGLFGSGTSMKVTTDASDTGTPEGWLDCQPKTTFQPFKNLLSVLWTQEEVDLFEFRVNEALQECLSAVDP